MNPCECGHEWDEHERTPARGVRTKCSVEGCMCIHYEAAWPDDEEPEPGEGKT